MIKNEEATYQCTPSMNGKGMFFYTDCCHNTMYSVRNDEMTYHGCLCPKCFNIYHKRVTLYLLVQKKAREF